MLNTQELHKLFEYKDGLLFRKVTTSATALKGSQCLSQDSKGYIRVGINKKKYSVHRIIFMMFHGYMPEFVDHIDGNKKNNKIENLRPVSISQNQQNRNKTKKNTSGYKGVSLHKRDNLYRARITINRKEKIIGYFKNAKDAYEAYCKAAAKYHTHNNHATKEENHAI